MLQLPYNVVLGSGSPRRKELLAHIVPQYTIIKSDAEEIWPQELALEKVPEFLAKLKADTLSPTLLPEDYLLITCDTTVIIGDEIINKPADLNEAAEMLKKLSGNTHTVISGLVIKTADNELSFSEATEVTFSHIPKDAITYYVENFKPLDRAGAYGIQDFIGMAFVKSINGCFYNVMGLPVHSLYHHLQQFTQK